MVEGWQRESVGSLFDVQLGKMLNKTAKEKTPQYPYLTNINVRWGAFDVSQLNTMFFSETEKSKFELQDGDILVCEGGEIGRCAVWDGSLTPCYYQKALHRLRPKGPILPRYFQVYMEHISGTKILTDFSSRTSIAHLTREKLIELPVLLPPLPEQRKIAEILRTWDEAIEKLEALRAAKLSRYGVLARRFFDPCHPAFQQRPNSWREFELGDVFRERTQVGKEGDTLLSITMSEGVIDRDDVGRKDTSNEDKSRYKLILPGDIGYNTMRMWQGVSGLSAIRGIVSPAYTIVTPDNRTIAARYAAHLFKSRRMVFDFQRYSQGLTSDTWNLKFPAFSKIKVFLPPIEQQEKQAELLDMLKGEIAVVKRQSKTLTRQKRGLMQKLLTGEWRVKR